jgi:hypothetical protein
MSAKIIRPSTHPKIRPVEISKCGGLEKDTMKALKFTWLV